MALKAILQRIVRRLFRKRTSDPEYVNLLIAEQAKFEQEQREERQERQRDSKLQQNIDNWIKAHGRGDGTRPDPTSNQSRVANAACKQCLDTGQSSEGTMAAKSVAPIAAEIIRRPFSVSN